MQGYQEGKHTAPASSSVGCSREWGGPAVAPGFCSLAKVKETFPSEEFRLLRLWQKERDFMTWAVTAYQKVYM